MPSATMASRPFMGNSEIAGRFPIGIAVFVIFSLAADIAEARQLHTGPNSHSTPFTSRIPKRILDYTGRSANR